jgi:hypothetical protein
METWKIVCTGSFVKFLYLRVRKVSINLEIAEVESSNFFNVRNGSFRSSSVYFSRQFNAIPCVLVWIETPSIIQRELHL